MEARFLHGKPFVFYLSNSFSSERRLPDSFKMKGDYKATCRYVVSFVQKRFLKASATRILSPHPSSSTLPKAPVLENSSSFTVKFLTESSGLPLQSDISVYRKLRLHQNNIKKHQTVLDFLKSHHFDDNQIARLIEKAPRFLYCRVEKNIKPKFEFLVANGFVGKLLPQLILSKPHILRISLEFKIKPCFECLKSYVDGNDKIALVIRRCPRLLYANLKGNFQLNIDFLIKEGMPLDRVSKLIVSRPVTLQRSHDLVVDAVNTVKNLGLEVGDNMFLYALAVRMQINERTWKKKIEVMKSLGWSEEETLRAFTRYPQILACSEKKIRSAMDFFVNAIELEPKYICRHPILLYYSVDKRVRPRYNIISALVSNNLIKGGMKMTSLLGISDKKFFKDYVVKHADEVPGLLEMFVSTAKTKSQDT